MKTLKIIVLSSFLFFGLLSGAKASTCTPSDILNGGTPTASDNDGVHFASNLTDNNLGTLWASDASFPHWIKYDLGSGVTKTPCAILINTTWDNGGSSVKDWSLYGSQDDSAYNLIATGTMPATGADGTWVSSTVPGSTAYRYVKITFDSQGYGGRNYMGAYEWEAYNCPDCTSTSNSTSSCYTGQCMFSSSTDSTIGTFVRIGTFSLVLLGIFLIAFITYNFFRRK